LITREANITDEARDLYDGVWEAHVNDAQGSSSAELHGSRIIGAIKASSIEFVVTVPDITTSEGLLSPISRDPDLRNIRVCKEDEGVGICAGLSYCNRRSLLLMQHTGLLDSINAIRAVAVEYCLPICMMVGLLEKEPERKPQDSARFGVRIVEPILDVMGITHYLIESDADAPRIGPAVDDAYAHSRPVLFLLGRRPLAS